MPETIKGINVVIGSDTTGLSSALSDVNKHATAIQSELKQVEKLLKLDPSNTELVSQKQKLLGDAITNTKEKLDRLKAAQEQVNAQFAKGEISEGQYRAFQREIAKTEQELRGLDAKLEETTREVKQHGNAVEKLGKDYQQAFDQAKQSMGNAFDQAKRVGQGVTVAGVAVAAGLGMAVNKAMDFEAQMSRVGAISDATGEQLQQLRQSALDLGASTSKSASEVAEGQEALAALGFTVEEILGAMPGVISAAEASGSDMAQTAEVMASTLNIFALEASEANRVADVLAKTANISAANLTDMQLALKYAGPPAAALGISLEELSAAIGIMTNAGMKGEQAGTTLRAALLGLLSPSEENSKLMSAMGVEITDAQGNFVGLSKLVQNLADSMKGQTDTQKAATLATLVGKEAVSGMLSLMAAGPEEIEKMTAALQNSGGASAEAALKMKDNLKGSLDELSGAFETMQISIGTALTPAIQALSEKLSELVNWFNKLSPTTQSFIAIGAVLTAALALIIGPLLILVGMLPMIAAGFGILLGPVGLVIAAVVALAAAAFLIVANWKHITKFFSDLWESVASATSTAWEGIKTFFSGLWDWVAGFFAEWGTEILAVILPFIGIPLLIFEHWDKIKAFFGELWENVKNVMSSAWNGIKSTISSIITSMSTWIKDTWNELLSWFRRLPGELYSIGSDMFTRMQEAVVSTVTGVKDAIVTGITEAIEWVKGLPEQMWEAGKNAIQGLIDGIQNMAGNVGDAIRNIASTITDGISNALNMHSPSRVMMQLGEYTGEGLAIGMQRSVSAISQQASAMAAAAVPRIGATSFQPAAASAAGLSEGAQSLGAVAEIIQVNATINMDGRKVAESVSVHQRSAFDQRARGKGIDSR